MKRILLILMLTLSLAGMGQTIPSYPNVKLTKLVQGVKSDSILVYNDKKQIRFVKQSSLGGGSVPTLDQVLTAGNTSTNSISTSVGFTATGNNTIDHGNSISSNFGNNFIQFANGAFFDGETLSFSQIGLGSPYLTQNQIGLGNGNGINAYDVTNSNYKLPQTIIDSNKPSNPYLAVSVNGNFADANGDITIPIQPQPDWNAPSNYPGGILNKPNIPVSVNGNFADENGNITVPDSRPYKVYSALLTQNGSNAPSAIVLENELSELPTYSYVSNGKYTINTVANIFGENSTASFIGASRYNSASNVECTYNNDNQFILSTYAPGTTNATTQDDVIYRTLIEIRVYPKAPLIQFNLTESIIAYRTGGVNYAVGNLVFTDADGTIPYADGSYYNVSLGCSAFVISNGIITQIPQCL